MLHGVQPHGTHRRLLSRLLTFVTTSKLTCSNGDKLTLASHCRYEPAGLFSTAKSNNSADFYVLKLNLVESLYYVYALRSSDCPETSSQEAFTSKCPVIAE